MKHFTRVHIQRAGFRVQRLIDDDGEFVRPFDQFVSELIGDAVSNSTMKAYCDAVAVFLDYLVELKVYGFPARFNDITEAVQIYPSIRSSANTCKLRYRDNPDEADKWDKVAYSLDLKPLSKNSFSNHTAAINRFLRTSQRMHILALEEARLNGLDGLGESPKEIFAKSTIKLNNFQKSALMKSSMLGSVIRLTGGIKMPRGLVRAPMGSGTRRDEKHLAFPVDHLSNLFDAATSMRDRAFWLVCPLSYKMEHPSGLSIGGSGSLA